MGGRGKRKSKGSGECPTKSRKRKTPAAVTPTRLEECPPTSDIDEPQVEEIIKVELDSDSERDINQQEGFSASDQDIDIGEVEVKVLRFPEDQLTLEAEDVDVGGVDSSVISEPESPKIDPVVRGNMDAATSASMSSEGRANGTCATDGDVEENNKTNSNFPSDCNRRPLLNKMAEKCETSTGMEVEDVEEDMACTTIGGLLLSQGATAAEGAQEMLTRSKSRSVKKDVSNKSRTRVSEKDVENQNMSNMQKTDGESITRLKVELKAATDHNKLLQRKLDSEHFRLEEMSNQLKQSEEDVLNYAAQCEGLKKQLEEAKGETEALQRELHTKNAVLETQTSQATLFEEEHNRLVQENLRTVERLGEELNKKINLLKDTISEKDAAVETVERRSNEIRELKKNIKQLKTENERLNNSVIPKQAIESKRLQDDNAGLKRLVKEKDEVIKMRTGEIEGLQKDFKMLKDNSKEHKAQIDDLLLETTTILVASSEGDADVTLKIIKLLIERRADVFATDGQGQTFLHKFISNQNPPTSSQFHDISEFLVTKKLASLFNIRDKDNGTTPLMLAARNVDLDRATTSLLLYNGAYFHRLDNYKRSYLSYAAEGNRNVKVLEGLPINNRISIWHGYVWDVTGAIQSADEDSLILFVWRGADVNDKNGEHRTPLLHAAMSTNKRFAINAIKFLINSGASVDAESKDFGKIFLHEILNGGIHPISPAQFHELATFLISKDLSRLFNTLGGFYWTTPFQLAVQDVEIDTATLSLLKDNGVNFNAVNGDEWSESVLYTAIQRNRTLRLISDLVTFGANPKHLTSNKESMLHAAAGNCRVDLLQFFLAQGLDINAQDSGGTTPLHCAIQDRENVIETVQFLLKNGADPCGNCDSETPLHLAARSTNKAFSINVIKLLINSGTNADAKDMYGSTFLHRLFNYGAPSPSQFHELACFLISKDLARLFNTPNNGSYTPLHDAVHNVEIEEATLTMLKNNGVDFNAVDNVDMSILHYVILGNRTLRLISELVALGANHNQLSIHGTSLLHMAADQGRVDLLNFFFNKGLDINLRTTNGSTPLHFAIKKGKNVVETVQFLLRNGADIGIADGSGKTPCDYFNEKRQRYSPDADKIETCFSLGASC